MSFHLNYDIFGEKFVMIDKLDLIILVKIVQTNSRIIFKEILKLIWKLMYKYPNWCPNWYQSWCFSYYLS